MNTNQKQLDNISFLRVFATLLVILGHSTYVYTNGWVFETANTSDLLNLTTKYIYSFHMPLFIFISGYLYYYLRKENNKYNDFKKFIKNKFFRLGVPYMIIGFFYLIPILLCIGYYKKSIVTAHMSFIDIIIKYYVLAISPEYLWFVFTLFFDFIIFYLIEKLIKKLNSKTIVNFFILLILNLLSFKLPQYFLINKIVGYLFYFYIGYIFRQYKESVYKILKIRFLLLYVFILQLFIFTIVINTNMKIINYLSEPALSLIGIFLCFGISTQCYNMREKCLSNKIFKLIDKDSYPIYLFHIPIIFIILNYFAKTNINPFLLTGMCLIISTVISIIITEVLRKFKLGFIWGEKFKINRQTISETDLKI